MNSQTTELLPCPFCGGAMQPRHALWASDGDTDSVIHAEPSECGLVGFSIGTADNGVSVAAAWNRRPALEHAQRVALPAFDTVWRQDYEWDGKRGYRYGREALEQVRFGYEIACKALAAATPSAGEAEARDAASAVIEAIAQEWDGCECGVFAVGMVDIGETIRRSGRQKLAAMASGSVGINGLTEAETSATASVIGVIDKAPCPRGASKPEPSCTNRHQCWEPCGELGHSQKHARVAGPDLAAKLDAALSKAGTPTQDQEKDNQKGGE